MAKKIKDSDLSIEERLEQALIPNWDEPHNLPSNWCWTRVDAIASIYTGNSINERVKEKKYLGRSEGLIYLATKDIDFDSSINYETNVRIPDTDGFKIAPKFSTLLCIEGGSAGRKIGFITQDVCFVNKLCAFVPHAKVDPKYLYYAIQSDAFKKQFDTKKHGLIGGVSIKEVSSIYIPLAPVDQQTRIVELIESVFYKFNEAAEKAQAVVDSFETRKAAILHKAFSGELTAKWREEHVVTKDSWNMRKINQVSATRAGYAFDSKKFTSTGYQIIRMGNLYAGKLDLSRNPVYISGDDVDELILKRSLINDGDILITLTGTKYKRDYGYAVCIQNPTDLLVNQRILCLSPNSEEIYTDYFLFYLQSDLFRNVFFSNETGGVNQGNVSSKFVENISFDVPTMEEQKEIGQLLRNILDKEEEAKETAEVVIGQIDTMKKAILAHAFRGELGTNDPSEESAIELLKQVLSTASEPKKTKKHTIIPKSLDSRIKTDLERKIIKLYIQNEVDVLLIDFIMGVSSKKFEIMEALRNLQQRGLLEKQNDKYKLLG